MIATGAHDMALWPLDASQVKVTFIDEASAADPVPCPVSCAPRRSTAWTEPLFPGSGDVDRAGRYSLSRPVATAR